MKKYNQKFLNDIKFYLRVRNIFDFDGKAHYHNKKGNNIIQYDKNGVDGIEAFHGFDSCGIIQPTKHPNILHTLLKIKGGVNLHIKMYAESRAEGTLSLTELRCMCIKHKTPSWFMEAIENQKMKYWKKF
jgi:hypothetical protein